MLNTDKEIAYQSDYVETKKMIKLIPEFNNDDFWKSKCLTLFPDEPYLDFYTGEENYLIREKKQFALAVDFDDEYCEKFLYEYYDMLSEILYLSCDKIDESMEYHIHSLYNFIPKKQFIVVNNKEENFIEQCNNELKAIEIIKDDSIYYDSDRYNKDIKYIIIDLKSITPYFWKLGLLSEKRESQFKVIKFEDIDNL